MYELYKIIVTLKQIIKKNFACKLHVTGFVKNMSIVRHYYRVQFEISYILYDCQKVHVVN